MRVFGNLNNRIMEGCNVSVPTVGMGATKLYWSDRKACTVVEVSPNGKKIGVKRDIATRTDSNGMSESQEYSYETDETAPIEYYTLRKNGAWVKEGESLRYGQRLSVGYREEYYDFSF